jgi:DnaJ-class molecular chaperone
VKSFHPDVSPRNEEKFREVQEAYDTLSDPEKKALYDREILDRRSLAVRPQSYYSHPLRDHPSSLFDEIDSFLGRVENLWVDEWSDFFRERERSHQDLSVEITLTPSEARRGCEVPLEIPFRVICRRCRGSGFVGELICGHCRGRGEQKSERKIEISIPPGVQSGTEMRIPLGDLGLRGGDLIAAVKVIRR